ncbi:S1 RNA-binding domain-containing protein [Streptococcus sp. ZJ93]|uniref:S1 RNA-binding domain-containing protein n=1 Tax=Streptococcus handemini TaxID=3161188 RepID=UPI0032ED2D97
MRIGEKLRGTVTGIQPYGAFVELENGTTGLIHISEIKTGYVDNIRDHLTIGQQLLVQVVDVDEYSKKASLSLRTLEEEKQKLPRPHRFTSDRYKIGFDPLAKQLPHWMKEARSFLEKSKEQ